MVGVRSPLGYVGERCRRLEPTAALDPSMGVAAIGGRRWPTTRSRTVTKPSQRQGFGDIILDG